MRTMSTPRKNIIECARVALKSEKLGGERVVMRMTTTMMAGNKNTHTHTQTHHSTATHPTPTSSHYSLTHCRSWMNNVYHPSMHPWTRAQLWSSWRTYIHPLRSGLFHDQCTYIIHGELKAWLSCSWRMCIHPSIQGEGLSSSSRMYIHPRRRAGLHPSIDEEGLGSSWRMYIHTWRSGSALHEEYASIQ